MTDIHECTSDPGKRARMGRGLDLPSGRSCDVVFDLFEYNPMANPGCVTALDLNRFLQVCLTDIARHRKRDPGK